VAEDRPGDALGDALGGRVPTRGSRAAIENLRGNAGRHSNPRPERSRVGIEAEHDLRLAFGDARREGVAEGSQISAP